MTRIPTAPKLGAPVKHKPGQWVQTERKAHEAWAGLIARKPRAAELLHHLIAKMGHQNAVVVPQRVLALIMGRSVDTVQRAIRDLVAEQWISVVKLNGPGTVSAYVVNDLVEDRWIAVIRIGSGKEAAYVVNDRVAWGQSRDQLRLSVFSATVIADHADQEATLLGQGELRRLPTLYAGEMQLPSGAGLEPPSQPNLEGLEPDLPTLSVNETEDSI